MRKAVESRGETWSGTTAVAEIAHRKLGQASQVAYLSGIRFVHQDDPGFLAEFEEAVRDLPQGASKVRPVHPVLPFEKVGMVLAAIRQRRTRREGLNERVVALVVATRLFGLRPSEWAAARWADESKRVLQVGNAKYARLKVETGPFAGRTWKRGNGKVREIVLPDRGREVYQNAADEAMAGEVAFPWAKNKQVIGYIHRAALRQLVADGELSSQLGEQVQIYSYRHSFAADAKYTLDLFAGEVAALMGHISITTATRSYSPRRKATGSVRVRPSNDSVNGVENRLSATARVIVRENERDLVTPDLFEDIEPAPVKKRESPKKETAPEKTP